MTKPMKADSLFQLFIKAFSDDFGIQNPADLETQKREIVPEFVQIDTVVTFPDNFNFTTLQDRIFPFWGQENVVEYKGEQDKLSAMHVYQYSLTELGILTTHFLSKTRKDRKERQPLSQQAAKTQWNQLTAQGAQHSCCNTILSTTDPIGVRNSCQFEPVNTYEHLAGALYRWVVCENDLVGNVATYLVVLNKLPVHPKNAPLLLLSTGKKQDEFCEWLLETHEGMSLQSKQRYLLYLTGYNLVKNKEVLHKMWNKMDPETNNDHFIIELLADRRGDDRTEFFQEFSKVILKTDSPIEAAQAVLQVDSPMEMAQAVLQVDSPMGAAQKMLQVDSPMGAAQKMLQVDSPMEMAQAALQADSPEEVVYKFIQDEEQMERLLEFIRQKNLEKPKA